MHTALRKTLLSACLAVCAVLALALPGSAAAATQSVTPTFTGDGANTDIVSLIAVCDECAPDIFFSGPFNTWGLGLEATVQAQASWNNPSTVEMSYTQSNLRHGQTLDLSDKLTTGNGTVHVTYSVSGLLGLYGTLQTGSLSCADAAVSGASCNGWEPTTDTLSIGPITGSDDVPCVMPLPGESPRDCTNTKTITIWNTDIFDFVDVKVNLILEEKIHVTGTGVTTLRVAVIAGGPAIPNNNLAFGGSSPSTVSDPIAITCTQPVGNSLLYSLTNLGYTADPATYTGDVKLGLEATVFGFSLGSFTTPPLFTTTGANLGPIAMSAPDQQVDLGPVLPNNIAPTVDAGGPYSGNEGSPITFDGTGTTSPCGFADLTLVWHFSDGGVAFGATPQHTFLSPGTFSGLLTVTDSDGNVASKAFSVSVANLAPVSNAGPNMSTKWGIPITLNGSAVDPGTDTQPFLSYEWDFGDGTPSASGGPSVNHTYATPGPYVATLTACDPLGACDSDQLQVVVNKRDTTTTYTGPNQSNPSKYVTFSATVVDEFGQAVVGRTVAFALGTQSISATTNSSGVASATVKLTQHKGDYTVSATFAGDSKYVASADSRSFNIGQ